MFDDILSNAKEMLDFNFDLELCEIIKSDGATPRAEGAFMFVNSNGESFGTIGGGTIEYEVTKHAVTLIKEKKDDKVEYDLSMKAAINIGMVCGGKNIVKFTYLTNDKKSYDILSTLSDKYQNKNTIYIFGGGHVSREVAKISKYVGFDYVVWDDRTDFANEERFEDAKKIICKPFDNILNEITIKDTDFIVIMTRGHACDYDVEKQVLNSKAYYIGCIGSRTKNKVLKDQLLKDGFSEEVLNAVHAPIGLSIGADTPEEIALSIVSELILFRAKLEGRRKVTCASSLLEFYKKKNG